MAWILLGAVLFAAAFFLLVFQQVVRVEARLRGMVVASEERLARAYRARLVIPGEETLPGETTLDADPAPEADKEAS